MPLAVDTSFVLAEPNFAGAGAGAGLLNRLDMELLVWLATLVAIASDRLVAGGLEVVEDTRRPDTRSPSPSGSSSWFPVPSAESGLANPVTNDMDGVAESDGSLVAGATGNGELVLADISTADDWSLPPSPRSPSPLPPPSIDVSIEAMVVDVVVVVVGVDLVGLGLGALDIELAVVVLVVVVVISLL